MSAGCAHHASGRLVWPNERSFNNTFVSLLILGTFPVSFYRLEDQPCREGWQTQPFDASGELSGEAPHSWSDGTKQIVATKEGHHAERIALPTNYWPLKFVLKSEAK